MQRTLATSLVLSALFALACGGFGGPPGPRAGGPRGAPAAGNAQAATPATALTAGTGSPGTQPPIRIVFKLHIEPTSIDGRPPQPMRDRLYEENLAQVDHTIALAAKHGAKLSIHANGEFFEYVHEQGDADHVRGWIRDGHHFGMHMHPVIGRGTHDWRMVNLRGGGISASEARALWKSHLDPAKRALPDFEFYAATPWDADADYAQALFEEFGFRIIGGGPDEIGEQLLGHHPWSPWRYKPGTDLDADPKRGPLLVPHRPQIGEAHPHGPDRIYQDNTVAHQDVQALQILLERQAAIRRGDAPRPWVFGILHHDNKGGRSGTERDADIAAQLGFFDSVLVRPGVATYATFDDVAAEYEAWEKNNPGKAPFRYARGEKYPYHLAGLARHLAANQQQQADWVELIAGPDAGGTHIHRLAVGPRGAPRPAWLLWRDDGTTATVTIPGASGSLVAVNGETGEETAVSGASVSVGAVPVLVLSR